jgi:hypothetical protein
VTHPGHQLGQRSTCLGGQRVAGVTEIVDVDTGWQASLAQGLVKLLRRSWPPLT